MIDMCYFSSDISFVCLQRFFLRWFIFLRSLKATLNNNVVTVTEPSFKKTCWHLIINVEVEKKGKEKKEREGKI
ncbi:unnamed protein product [Rhizophagus irregularis]|nr:unnamed protein product [Rhizophagus irregularis]